MSLHAQHPLCYNRPSLNRGVPLNEAEREAEIAQLGAQFGMPIRRHYALDVGQATHEWWSAEKARRRDGEVVLFILRGNGNVVLHTKDFYPPGAFRVPSGGIRRDEPLLNAVQREAWEETGLQVVIERFLAVLGFEFRFQGQVIPYPSYLFLLREVGGELKTMDAEERITGFAEAPLLELLSIAERLENVPPSWHDWGLFRAIPHRVAAELLGVGGLG